MTNRDLTRFLFQPRKHYAAARMQQGRTLLDSDQGEGETLEQEEWRRAVLDIVGPRGTPDGGFSLGSHFVSVDAGNLFAGDPLDVFSVSINGTQFELLPIRLRIGSFYLGGMRLEMREPEFVYAQRDFLQAGISDLAGLLPGAHSLFYLEAWEQEVSAIEDEEILERALGGPDTTVRVRRFRRVRTVGGLRSGISCAKAFREQMEALEKDQNSTFDCQTSELVSKGRLQLVFQPGSDGDPCTPDPPTQYLGTENQAIRIMLTKPDRYVWAFDDAAPLYRATMGDLDSLAEPPEGLKATIRIQIETPFKDEGHKPRVDQAVELLPFAATIDNQETSGKDNPIGIAAAEIGIFAPVVGLDNEGGVTIDVTGRVADLQALVTRWDPFHPNADQLTSGDAVDPGAIYVRFWHDRTPDQELEIPIGPSPGTPLGDTGIIPLLHTPGRRGDFWIAALRPDTPTRIVPFDLLSAPQGVPPHGPHHFFAALAVLQHQAATGPIDEEHGGRVKELHDCRPRMRKLVDAGCATFTVGDGLHNVGDYTRIQDAIDALPPEGGRVFILPGIYRQNITLLPERRDVVIEGCGDDTIIETPTTGAAPALITLDFTPRITLSSLRLHAVEQQAISATGAADLRLSGLSALAFVEVAGRRRPGAISSEEALINLIGCPRASVHGVHLEPARRPGLLIRGPTATGTTVVALSAVGSDGSDENVIAGNPPTRPMIAIQNLDLVTLRDVSLLTFGQVGIALEGNDQQAISRVRMSALTIVARPHESQAMRMAVDIDGSEVVLEDSDITFISSESDDAAVVAHGNDLVIRGNKITTQPFCVDPNGDDGCDEDTTLAWGGLQIRGGSADVVIEGNTITGALGHGITLGSVLWDPGDGSRRREGAGKAQIVEGVGGRRFITGNLGEGFTDTSSPPVQFLPIDEGTIEGLVISENRIEAASTNGISALTVFGLATSGSTDIMEIRNSRIERNTITGNLKHPYDQVPARTDILPFPAARHDPGPPQNLQLSIPVLPFGGIVLATATGRLTISGNSIVSNGQSTILPHNGIFVLNGDGILIQQNRIAANGGAGAVGDNNELRPGVRGGIAIMFAGTDAASSSGDLDDVLEVTADELFTLDANSIALRVAGNSVQQPEGRALHAVAAGSVSIDGNFLSSQGNHGAETLTEESIIGDVVFVQNIGTPWEATDAGNIPEEVPGPDNTQSQFSPNYAVNPSPSGAKAYLTNSVASSPRLFTGVGGSLLFANNQVVYDWVVQRPPPDSSIPLSIFAVVLMTLDHVGCVGNQFAMRVDQIPEGLAPPFIGGVPPGFESFAVEPLLSHALIGGGTAQVARNRFAENVQACSLSAITLGQMLNITAFNQGTHPFFAYRPPRVSPNGTDPPVEQVGTFISEPNHSLFVRPIASSARIPLLNQVLAFFQLLHQP